MTARQTLKRLQGFTLIEILLVVAMISILAVAVFVALNPAKRIIDSKNARRQNDVDSILSAVHQYIVDQKGALPGGLAAGMVETQLGTGLAAVCSPLGTAVDPDCGVVAATACVDLLSGANDLAKYLKSMPVDPTAGTTFTDAKTGYSIEVDTNGIVTVKACGSETPAGESTVYISASR